jgi:folylpolyglutamate synthase/dihydropteroate synthase
MAGSFSIAVLIAAAALGWGARDRRAHEQSVANERLAKQAKTSGQLELILTEVARLEKAERWSEALSSLARAEAVIEVGEAPVKLQEHVHQVLADLKLIQRLEETRAQSGTPWGVDVVHNRETEQAYAKAFREFGIDVDSLPVSEAVRKITERDAIASALLPALNDWGVVRSTGRDDAASRRLMDVIQGADPDLWRKQVRDALIRKDWTGIERLARSHDLDQQPAATLSLVCSVLTSRARVQVTREEFLRRAQWKYPDDYWINQTLGVALT